MIEALRKTGNAVGKVAGRGGLGRLLDYLRKYKAYLTRITTAGGTVQDDTVTKQIYKMLQSNNLYDNTLLLVTAEGGLKVRQSGAEQFVEVAYDMGSVPNDAAQTTESLQPFVGGRIAPNEKQGFVNENGQTKYIAHPTISFAANEAWSVTTVLDWNGKAGSDESYAGASGGSRFSLRVSSVNRYYLFTGSASFISAISTDRFLSKKTVITWVADAIGNVSLYVNGVFVESKVMNSSISINSLMLGRFDYFAGSIPLSILQNIAPTPTQVASIHSTLSQIWPEIPTIQIGSQHWATSNFRAVATPLGNVIANVTANATWAGLSTAAWSFYNNDAALGAVYGKQYNKYGVNLLVADIATQGSWGYHVATEAELTTLALNGGFKLKKEGIDYWNTATGTNTTGFSAIGGGARSDVDGAFSGLKSTVAYWCADSNKVLLLNHADNSATIVAANPKYGAYVRLVKN